MTPEGNTGSSSSKVLLVYFSRAGENYYYGDRIDLEVGNTEVVANMIASTIAVDVYRIQAADPYPQSYDETVRTQQTGTRRGGAPSDRGSLCPQSTPTTPCCSAARSGTSGPHDHAHLRRQRRPAR